MHHWSGHIDDATDEWLPQWPHDPASPLRSQLLFQFIYISYECFEHLSQYFYTLYLTGFQSGEFGGQSWGGINFGVTFSDNEVITRARSAIQVSQGSVQTLFRWGGKHLHNFAANLLRKLYTKFHQNRQNFLEDITENILVSFFWIHCTNESLFHVLFSVIIFFFLFICVS